jgi:tRNA (guanine-N7-)-methyltransferase
VSKAKLAKFAEMRTFGNVFQPAFEEVSRSNFHLKGQWNKIYFKNQNPVVVELGCGKGEYTTGLAEKYPEINFIGVDIKGARIWTGAKYALEKELNNVAFVRTCIEFVHSLFDRDEIREIWLTFPDPQAKKKRNKKRLTGSRFLKLYQQFLINQGIIHLKTDHSDLFKYTIRLIKHNHLNLICSTTDFYNSGINGPMRDIQTFYEKQFLDRGLKVYYLAFKLDHEKEIEEPEDE